MRKLDFTGDYTTKFNEEVSAMWADVKNAEYIDVELLLQRCDVLIEAYVTQTGERPKSVDLGRLGSLLVYDYTSSPNRWKSREENAFQSNSQIDYVRRMEVAGVHPEKVANTGVDKTALTKRDSRATPYGRPSAKV